MTVMTIPLHASIAAPVLAVLVAIGSTGSAASARAQDAGDERHFWMTDKQLAGAFAGTEITGNYNDGRTFNERYDTAGALHYVEHQPQRSMTGHWSVTNGRFCTIYDTSGTGGCFRVRQVSANCFEFYFDTRTEAEARRSTPAKPTWTARAWRIANPPTCDGKPTV